MKIVTVIGARPQFIKAAVISREIKKHPEIQEVIVHTGQHYDKNMSDVFFEEMHIPKPDYNLEVHGMNHGAMTGQMMEKLEPVLLAEKPDWVLVYGDTNSTLAGALTAKKLHFKVAHVEAGLRSFNMKMPEEINRILTDRISDVLFCPTDTAIRNLKNEGVEHWGSRIIKSGDVMYDAALFYADFEKKPDFEIPEKFILCTVHRAENTDNEENLKNIAEALCELAKEINIVLPLHPRTKSIIQRYSWSNLLNIPGIFIVDPVGYLEVIYLLKRCSFVMTDSGGMQKEAYFFKKPCIILREETEWIELVELNYNKVVGTNKNEIIKAATQLSLPAGGYTEFLYGNGKSSAIIINSLLCKV